LSLDPSFSQQQQQVWQHSKIRSGGFFFISFISSFLGEDGRQSSKTGGSTGPTETDRCYNNYGWIMLVAKKEKRKERSIESNHQLE
jgi:hypothetical protein